MSVSLRPSPFSLCVGVKIINNLKKKKKSLIGLKGLD